MTTKKAKRKPQRKYEQDEPVSLHPLDLRTALAGLMGVRPKPTNPPASDSPQASKADADSGGS